MRAIISPLFFRNELMMSINKIYLELTNRCNLDCSICFRKTWHESPLEITQQTLKNFNFQIKELPNLKSIVLGGIGEPLYSLFIENVILNLKDYELIITSNGTIGKKKLLQTIARNVNLLIISIDGSPQIHKKIRGSTLETVIINLKNIQDMVNKNKKNKLKLQVQFVASTENIQDIFKVMDLLDILGIDTLVVSNLLPQDYQDSQRILYTRYENKKIRNLFDKMRLYAYRKSLKLILPEYELRTERRCNFIENNSVYITAAGDVVPCYRFSHNSTEWIFGREKKIAKYSFGNINQKKLIDIWNSSSFADFRQMVYNNRYPSCTDCDLVEGCDMATNADYDCYGFEPSCADCLWSRKIIQCP